MRALLVLALVGCTPDVAPGAYLCGPEQACPPGQACDGSDNTCVVASSALPFACDPMVEHEPDDTPQQGVALPALGCVSNPVRDASCIAAGDAQDWVTFVAPTGCTAVEAKAEVSYPVAYEPLTIDLWELGGMTEVAPGGACAQGTGAAGDDARCLQLTLTPGASYGIEVHPAGGGDCGGTCNYNRYTLTVQTDTPG
jgi:hypothetical protein